MKLEEFTPQSKLVTKTTPIERPRFPAIDAHNHLGEDFGGGWDKRPVSELLDLLDEAGIVRYVDLDGGWGEARLNSHLDHFKERLRNVSRCSAAWIGANGWKRGMLFQSGHPAG